MNRDERLLELLAARATEGLAAEDVAELDRLLPVQDEWRDDDLELAAAALHVGMIRREGLEPMPDALRQSVIDSGERAVGHPAAGGTIVSFDAERRERRGFDLRGLGWYAAAAILLLAIWAPWSDRAPGAPVVQEPAELRARLIGEAADIVTASWSAAEAEYGGVSGDVVWSSSRQAGFLRLRGLPANRPQERQYQLWIVDPARDAEPVDGGVFDVPAGDGDIVIPIDAKLDVIDPTVFAITLEQPGGVVVSEGPLLVVASLT